MQILIQCNGSLHAEPQSGQVENVRVLDTIPLRQLLLEYFGTVDGDWLPNITASTSEYFIFVVFAIEDLHDLGCQLSLLLLG